MILRTVKRFIRLHKPLVLNGIVLCVSLVALFVGLVPSLQKTIMLIEDIRTLGEEVDRIQDKLNVLQSLDSTELENASVDVLAAVPSDKSIETLLSTVEAVANKNGMVISDLSIESIGTFSSGSAGLQVKPEGIILTETVSLKGEITQIRNFLSDCLRVRRLLRIKSLELSAVPKSTDMTARLGIEVFYLPLPTTIGKASDPLKPFSEQELSTLAKIRSYPIAYAPEGAQTSTGPSVVGQEPTVPVLSDPFFPSTAPVVSPLVPSISPVPSPSPSIPLLPISPSASPSAGI